MEKSGSRTAYGNSGGMVAALIVIAIGVVFLLDNFGISFGFMEYHNWWAVFILVGAVGPLNQATRRFRAQGRVDGVVLHSLVSTAAIIAVALMFLLDLSWNLWWPLFIIFGGLWMLANNWKRDSGVSSS
jgi:hypothetical protein